MSELTGTALPDEVTYGTIVGQLVSAVLDTDVDEDANPDMVPVRGKVTFTLQSPYLLEQNANLVILPQPVTVSLDDNGGFQVTLIATDSPGLNGTGWTYKVDFSIVGLFFESFSLELPGGTTQQLATITPVPASTGDPILRGETGPAPTMVAGTATTLTPDQNATVDVEPVPGQGGTYSVSVGIPKGDKGDTGNQGIQGLKGDKGDTGNTGPANTLSIGTVNTSASESDATITGTAPNQTLNLTLQKGDTGPANTLDIGTVITGSAGSSAAASITGTSPNQILNLTIPQGAKGDKGDKGDTGVSGVTLRGEWDSDTTYAERDVVGWGGSTYYALADPVPAVGTPPTGTAGSPGSDDTAVNSGWGPFALQGAQGPQGDKGDKGDTGDQGIQGNAGPSNVLSIGTVTTGAPDTNASASITGTSPSQVLNLTIPQGEKGDKGDQGEPGTGDVSTVNNITPDNNGNVTLTPANIEAVPTTRAVNGKTLNSDIALNAKDVEALGALYCQSVSLVQTTLSGLRDAPATPGDSGNWIEGSIVLLVNQSDGTENGPWVVHSGPWTRPPEFTTGTPGTVSMFLIDSGGSKFAGSQWVLNSEVDENALIGDVSISINPILQSWTASSNFTAIFPVWKYDSDTGLPLINSAGDLWQTTPLLDSSSKVPLALLPGSNKVFTPCDKIVGTNITELSGLGEITDSLGGIFTPIDGEIILLSAQTTASQNGPWVAHSGNWTRPASFASGEAWDGKILTGGPLNGVYFLFYPMPYSGTIDTDALTFYLVGPAIDGGGNTGSVNIFGLDVDTQTAGHYSVATVDDTTGSVSYSVLPVGTTSGTVAAGDDSRITGSLQKSGTNILTGAILTSGGGYFQGKKLRDVITTANASYPLNSTLSDVVVFVSTSASTVTLPSETTNIQGAEFTIVNAGTGTVTIAKGTATYTGPTSIAPGNALTLTCTEDSNPLTYTATAMYAPTGTTSGTVAAGNDSRIVNAVPNTRTVNGKALSGNITLAASDVSAVPTTRTVNGKALNSDVTLTASDVGALRSTNNLSDLTDTATALENLGIASLLSGSMHYLDSFDPNTQDASKGDFFQYNGSWYVCAEDFTHLPTGYLASTEALELSGTTAQNVTLPTPSSGSLLVGDTVLVLQRVQSAGISIPPTGASILQQTTGTTVAYYTLTQTDVTNGYITVPAQGNANVYLVSLYVFRTLGTAALSLDSGSGSSSITSTSVSSSLVPASTVPTKCIGIQYFSVYVAAGIASTTINTSLEGLAHIVDNNNFQGEVVNAVSVAELDPTHRTAGSFTVSSNYNGAIYYAQGLVYLVDSNVLPSNFIQITAPSRRLLASLVLQTASASVQSLTFTVPSSGQAEILVSANTSTYSGTAGLRYGLTATGTDLGYIVYQFAGFGEGRALIKGLTPGASATVYIAPSTTIYSLNVAAYSA